MENTFIVALYWFFFVYFEYGFKIVFNNLIKCNRLKELIGVKSGNRAYMCCHPSSKRLFYEMR